MESYQEFANRRKNKATIEFGIVCVVTDNNQQFLWILYLPVPDNMNTIFRTQENLVQMRINKRFNRYKAIQV